MASSFLVSGWCALQPPCTIKNVDLGGCQQAAFLKKQSHGCECRVQAYWQGHYICGFQVPNLMKKRMIAHEWQKVCTTE